jgi:adenine-specific DNA-methyltransferase
VEFLDGTRRSLSKNELQRLDEMLANGAKLYRQDNIISTGYSQALSRPLELGGNRYSPGAAAHWKTTLEGLARLADSRRIEPRGGQLAYVRYLSDFPVSAIGNLWDDVVMSSRSEDKLYSVQTSSKAIQRSLLMTTDPGDLILDPTCGSGTTAYVAEQWGRRWITCDTSRVPLALTRQRMLTAIFPYYELKEPGRGPGGGFVYKRKQNKKGEEIGGLVPHITLKSIANNEEPKMEVLVDRPEEVKGITRVAGPFTVEATIPAAAEIGAFDEQVANPGDFPSPQTPLPAGEGLSRGNPAAHIERMLEFLRRSETLRLPGNETLHLQNVRRLTDTEHLHAEAMQPGDGERRVAIVFGPEDGAIVSDVVFEAARRGTSSSTTSCSSSASPSRPRRGS